MREVRGARDNRRSADRDATDQSRREAWAARMASLILSVFFLYLLMTCLHLFTGKL